MRLQRELAALKAKNKGKFDKTVIALNVPKPRFETISSGAEEPTISELQHLIYMFELSADYILKGIGNATALTEADLRRWKTMTEQLRHNPAQPFATQNDILCDGAVRVLEEIADQGYTVVLGAFGSPNACIVTTYPEEWRRKYLAERLYEVDPVIAWSMKNFGISGWDELPVNRAGKNFMKMAREFGLSNGTVVVTQVFGRRCFVSLAHSKLALTNDEINVVRTALTVVASLSQGASTVRLSTDTVALADYLASGMSDQEIATVTGVSDRTIRSRKRELIDQTKSRTLIEAVCRSMGWRDR